MDSDTPKKWVSRKKTPRVKQPDKHPELNSWGIPQTDTDKIFDSYLNASWQWLQEVIEDPLHTWPTVANFSSIASSDAVEVLNGHLIKKMFATHGTPGKRFDLAKKNRTPAHCNKWVRSVFIISNWVEIPIEDELVDIGLCYFTDETAALWISIHFPELGDFSVKQFRDLREKYNLIQVPPQYRISGVFKNDVLTQMRIGKKRI